MSTYTPAFIIDIDGVIMHSTHPIAGSKEALQEIQKSGCPYMFLTNSCRCVKKRANWMSTHMGLSITPDQVISPVVPMVEVVKTDLVGKRVFLISDRVGDDELELAKDLGLDKFYTFSDMVRMFPNNDVMAKTKRAVVGKDDDSFEVIDAIVMVGSPSNWEGHMQFMLDILCGMGHPNNRPDTYPKVPKQVPIYNLNMDFGWMHTPVVTPRLGNGAFSFFLEQMYEKLTGTPLVYEKLLGKPSPHTYEFVMKKLEKDFPTCNITHVFGIGDNPGSDVSGANSMKQRGSSDRPQFRSILVKTGVYKGGPCDQSSTLCVRDLEHISTVPDLIVENFAEATNEILNSSRQW